jgi:stage II sporulation protein D
VLPVEMGPAQFPELEALKAQAVAARTYAVAHLGDHEDEGYDLCATAACQAYNGVDVEHPLSSRAVSETAGLVATYDGTPIDAMYTSTCGGHTEDAGLLFAGREQPYLKGVACAWDRPIELHGEREGTEWYGEMIFEEDLARRALGLDGPFELGDLLDALARVCQGAGRSGRPLDGPDDVARALLDACALGDAATAVSRTADPVSALLALGDLYAKPIAPPPATISLSWSLRAGLMLLEVAGAVDRDRGELVPHPEGAAIYPRGAERSEALAGELPLLERWGPSLRERARIVALPGTQLERVRQGDEVLALIVVRSGGDDEADRRSAWRSWVRERSLSDLAKSTGVADLERLEIGRRATSGRVVELIAIGRSGQGKRFEGFELRRALDLPETLFAIKPIPGGVRFLGRGWGHGVGLCQNGAYGLARAGRLFDDILKHYYTGVAIEPWSGALTTPAAGTDPS